MLTISGITAVAEKAAHLVRDIDYTRRTREREHAIVKFRNQDYVSMKRWLQTHHCSFRDNLLLTDSEDDVVWIPIERPRKSVDGAVLSDDGLPMTFFSDSVGNVKNYVYAPGKFISPLFLSALTCVMQHPLLIQRIIPIRNEQHCTDIYKMPENVEADFEESDDSGEVNVDNEYEGEENGQFSSYEACTAGDEGAGGEYVKKKSSQRSEDKEVEEATYGLFSSSYGQEKGSTKLGIWDSDTYTSSEEDLYNQQQQQQLYESNYLYNDDTQQQQQDFYFDQVPNTPSPTGEPPKLPVESGPTVVYKYAGIFRFRFWNDGRWCEVVVDEMLPYSNDEPPVPLSTQAVDADGNSVRDLWLPLLEKAYAKVLGRYECISTSRSGCIEDFLTDLTGGMCETIHLRTSQHRNDDGLQASLGDRMRVEFYSGIKQKLSGGRYPGFYSVLCAVDEPHNPKQEGKLSDYGLIYGRVYPVTDVREISLADVEALAPNSHKLLMVRLKDPFGPASWNGPFSRGSPEWLAMSPIERARLGLICETECDFWMPLEQFCSRFSNVTFCRIFNKQYSVAHRKFWENVVEGSWRTTARMAGGSFDNNRETFLRNPQYLFRIEPHHDYVMISLSQQLVRQNPSQERLSIGFTVLHVEENRIYRVHHIPTPEPGFAPIVETTHYRHTGPVFLKLLLYHGRYVIIPTTNEAFKDGNFLLRLVSNRQCYLRYLNQNIPARHYLMPYPMCVTRIRVIRASSLQRLDRPTGPINAYCLIWCERHWVRTKTIWHNTDPEWNQSAIFYRRWSATLCVKVVIWHHAPKLYPDQYLGKHIFQAYEETGRPITVSLYGRRRWENNQPRSGVLTVEITSAGDVGAL